MANFFDLIGRIMISAIFLFSGINQIVNYDGTVGGMVGFGMPGFLLIPAIIIEILFPLMVIVGYKTRIAAGGLLLFSLLTSVKISSVVKDNIGANHFNKQLRITFNTFMQSDLFFEFCGSQ